MGHKCADRIRCHDKLTVSFEEAIVERMSIVAKFANTENFVIVITQHNKTANFTNDRSMSHSRKVQTYLNKSTRKRTGTRGRRRKTCESRKVPYHLTLVPYVTTETLTLLLPML